jgi:ATP-binding cassette subfamily C protein
MMMLFIIGGNQVIDSKLSVGNFLALSSYYTLSIGAISYFLSLGSEFVTAKVSYDRILEIIPDNKDISQASKLKLAEINEIEIKNLDFNYFDKNIFKNFSYIFKTNHIYGITGANGRGKSTLLQLLVGIYSADKGSILFNNIALSNLDLYYLRCNCISTMEQEPLIVPGKVSDNILLFKGQSCFLEEKINIWQEKLINKDLLYRNINSSLETTLSKGEIQKIAFLRTISKDSSLMIFDEPTASIDMETKQIMIKAIRECSKNKIVIVISHDEDVCKNLCTDLIKL